MKIYYYICIRTGKKFGSVNEEKIKQMSKRASCNAYYSCDISEFETGNRELLSSEWNG